MDLARPAKVSVSLALLLLVFAFGIVSCAKHESVAERNAEIDRRIDERLAAKQAEEQQRLAQEQAALEAREKALEARETFFATMVESVSAQTAPASTGAADSSYLAQESYPVAEPYSSYPDTSGETYPGPYGYVSGAEPYFSDPYFCPPTTAFVTVINQNALILNLRRNPRRRGGGQQHRGDMPALPAPPSLPREPVVSRPPVIVQRPPAPRPAVTNRRPPLGVPMQTLGQRPIRSVGAPQVVNRPVAAKPNLQRTW